MQQTNAFAVGWFFSCTLLLEKFDFLIASFVRYNACSRNSDYTDSPAERQGGEQQKNNFIFLWYVCTKRSCIFCEANKTERAFYVFEK